MFVFHDQDALNAILYDQWLELHPRWNAQTHIILKEKHRLPSSIKSAIWKQGQTRQSFISAAETSLGIQTPHTRTPVNILSICSPQPLTSRPNCLKPCQLTCQSHFKSQDESI